MSRFFDLQVNGYAGVDFNAVALDGDQLAAACRRLVSDGVSGILATVITDEVDRMVAKIESLVRARESDSTSKQMVAGIHIEGPFISGEPGYVGTHPTKSIRAANVSDAERMIDAGEGLVRLVTLAPEQDPAGTTVRWLNDRGIAVSAGHTNASLHELRTAIDQGLSLFTHLGNGCPLSLPRHGNIIQRALSMSDRLWTCFIADGVHVPFHALANYLKLVGDERAVIVSDCISAAGLGPGEFTLGDQQVVVDEQLATWSADKSHLMGSALTLPQAYTNLVERLAMTPERAHRLTCDNPRKAVGLG
jgi:N-acetylglucosamine-6-phosphate deacetylase